jgi:hypothetical protein
VAVPESEKPTLSAFDVLPVRVNTRVALSLPPTVAMASEARRLTTLFVAALVTMPEPVVVVGAVYGLRPVLSHVARPPNCENVMPTMLLPSKPTEDAGTSRRTQVPAAGMAPIARRPAVLIVP